MTEQLQSLIKSARDLSPLEQAELIDAVSHLMHTTRSQSWASDSSFWNPKELDVLIREQQIRPIRRLQDVNIGVWPAGESADEFISYTYQQRQQDQTEG